MYSMNAPMGFGSKLRRIGSMYISFVGDEKLFTSELEALDAKRCEVNSVSNLDVLAPFTYRQDCPLVWILVEGVF